MEKYDKIIRDGLSKVCNVNFDDISSTLPAECVVLGRHSHLYWHFRPFWPAAFGASDFLWTNFSEPYEDVSFTKALENWLSLTNQQKSPLDGTQTNWTQPVYVKTIQGLTSRMDSKCSRVFNAHQGRFGSQWINVVPCKNLDLKFLKLDDQQLRISFGLRLGANICVAHTCHCGKRVERDGLHALFCTNSACRFSRHVTLILLNSRTARTVRNKPGGVTMIPWGMG